MLDLEEKPRRAVLVSVQLPSVTDEEFERSLDELRSLAKTLGVIVVGSITQKRSSFDPGAYLGSGKREDLKTMVGTPPKPKEKGKKGDDAEDEDDEEVARADAEDDDGDAETPDEKPRLADTIILDHEVSPSQARNLEKETGCDVLDRTAVILEIFHRHARSRAAKAQVEIVRLQYMAPRMRDAGKGKDRARGGIGGKGAGESNLELDRRKIRDRVAELQAELSSLEEERRTQRARRAGTSIARVALVGYTNAGKSTLMRALTGSDVYVADKLFATLDTTVRTLHPDTVPRILVSDTVGFIKNLPHGLVASFKSTLDEALEASLLLHVVDASDPGFERQLAVTEAVLDEIGAHEVPRLVVLNKIDRVGDEAQQAEAEARLRERYPEGIILSAKRHADVMRLRQVLVEFFSKDLVEGELVVRWDRQALRGEIYTQCQVLEEKSDEEGTTFRARAPGHVLERLRAQLE